jgi:hypothetical protein
MPLGAYTVGGGIGYGVTPFGVPVSPFAVSGSTTPVVASSLGGLQFAFPREHGIPSGLTNVLQRLLFALPRWGVAVGEQLNEANRVATIGSGTTLLDVQPIVPRGLSKKQLKKFAKQNYFAVPTQLSVATYGVNRALISGSRDDPAGGLAPPKYPFPGRLS